MSFSPQRDSCPQRSEKAELQRIWLNLPIDCPEIHSPTTGLKAEPRLRPTSCVPRYRCPPPLAPSCFSLPPHLLLIALLRCKEDRTDEASASSASACLPPLVFTKMFANLPGYVGNLFKFGLALPSSTSPHPKCPIPYLLCLKGTEEEQRKLTVQQACMQTIRRIWKCVSRCEMCLPTEHV